jgi:hypothetical protein
LTKHRVHLSLLALSSCLQAGYCMTETYENAGDAARSSCKIGTRQTRWIFLTLPPASYREHESFEFLYNIRWLNQAYPCRHIQPPTSRVGTDSLEQCDLTVLALKHLSFCVLPPQGNKAGTENGRQDPSVFMYLSATQSFLSLNFNLNFTNLATVPSQTPLGRRKTKTVARHSCDIVRLFDYKHVGLTKLNTNTKFLNHLWYHYGCL